MVNLVIMESPSKAATVKSYLGSSYKVVASKGHVRDLPKSSLGIDLENNFEAHYINIRGKGDLIKELRREVKKADRVFLATDPDREGEAIAWHLVTALDIPENKIKRVTFNAVTKSVVKESIKAPRDIDMNIVNAQQTRRLLDRIVGYKISPILWKSVKSGLSAGRVQSVATRVIVDRENEIKSFIPEEYWNIEASLASQEGKSFTAKFFGKEDGTKIELHNEEEAMAVVSAVNNGSFRVADVKAGRKMKNPAAPFITSTLQQEASRKLNFQSQRTMRVAQELYEGVSLGAEYGGVQGLITYMRTDSLRVSEEAQNAARDYIINTYGNEYCPASPRVYKTKSNAQDAHEAIRPSLAMIEPKLIRKSLTPDQYKLYKLIWERFIASQMQSAELSTLQYDIVNSGYLFRAGGYTIKFKGYMSLYEESTDDAKPEEEGNVKLPELAAGEILRADKVDPSKHFTEPPARYNEASLVKFLEEKGIGRPSTYATIITTITTRGYVKREGKSLYPTELGFITTDLMCRDFPDIVDCGFTADMESSLDAIENGTKSMLDVLNSFYGGFQTELEAALAKAEVTSVEVPAQETDIICEFCGARMVVKNGRYGRFAACPNYPACKNTKPLTTDGDILVEKKPEVAEEKCELCGADMILRTGRYGSFYACSRYPECKNTRQKVKPLGVKCPECGADIVVKIGKRKTVFYSCMRYPECQFSSWDVPTNEKCPTCGGMLFRKKGKNLLICKTEGCGYTVSSPEETPQRETEIEDDE